MSDANIIEASRDFVCIRTATYEDAEEAEFLEKIYTGRSGDLENTVFALLTPDADEFLSRSGRGPQFAYRSPGQMADAMRTISLAYPGNDSEVTILPQMKNFRLALNVASCDALPLVAAVSDDPDQLATMSAALSSIAFSDALAGRFHFVATNTGDVAGIHGYKSNPGIYVIMPGTYGTDGEILAKVEADASLEEFSSSLTQLAASASMPDKSHNQHVRTGMTNGHNWETEIPVTDQMSLRAMQGRSQNQSQRGQRDQRRPGG